MINNPFFFWFWLSLLLLACVVPIYLIQSVFFLIERMFAIVFILWKGAANVFGATVGFTQQANRFAEGMANGNLTNNLGSSLASYFMGTPTLQQKNQVAKLVGYATTGSIAALSTNYTVVANAIDQQVGVLHSTWEKGIFGFSYRQTEPNPSDSTEVVIFNQAPL